MSINSPHVPKKPSDFIITDDKVLAKYKGTDTNVVIPDGVIVIGESAFRECRTIKSVTIPESVCIIKDFAFFGCHGLESIYITEYLVIIHENAFSDCINLQKITVHSENEIFHSCNNCMIETREKTLIKGCDTSIIPDDGSVENIGASAFVGSNKMRTITIPETIRSIRECAFAGCKNLKNIKILSSEIEIDICAFIRCNDISITAEKTSEAINYAKENRIPFFTI